ncbi:MAG TPA: formyl transferase [Candidatus Acidoferrum sp.]|nr:formyl transferase [Candidatus Acidoferrum sp.]
MRVEFLTQDDPLYVFPFFEEFVCSYASEFEIVQISSSPTMGKRPRMQMLKELTQLYGVWGMGRLVWRLIGSRLLGAFPKRTGAGKYASLSQLCQAYSIPCARIDNPNAAEFVEKVRRRSPDVLVSVACPFIVKEPLLSIAPKGAINIHHAPLPKYRGMMPTFWQMYHGEKRVGLTIHYMVAKVDEGEALFQDEQAITPGESLDCVIRRSKRHGAHCMADVLRQIASHSQSSRALNSNESSYFTFPTTLEIREFRRRGYRPI